MSRDFWVLYELFWLRSVWLSYWTYYHNPDVAILPDNVRQENCAFWEEEPIGF